MGPLVGRLKFRQEGSWPYCMVQMFITVRVLEQQVVVSQSSNASETLKNDSMEPSGEIPSRSLFYLQIASYNIQMVLLNIAGLDDPSTLVAMTLTVQVWFEGGGETDVEQTPSLQLSELSTLCSTVTLILSSNTTVQLTVQMQCSPLNIYFLGGNR